MASSNLNQTDAWMKMMLDVSTDKSLALFNIAIVNVSVTEILSSKTSC
jgi:hypothetical protein